MIRFALGCVGIIVTVPAVLIAAVWFTMSAADKDALGYYATWGALGLAALAAMLAIKWGHDRWERRDRTMVDGAFPLKKFRVHEWNEKVPWPLAVVEWAIGSPGELDRNRIGAAAYHIRFNGQVVEHVPAWGWAAQGNYNDKVETTNVFRAITQGDDSRNNIFGRDSAAARLAGAQSLVNRPSTRVPDEPPALTVAPEPALSPQTALERSSNGVVYIGQQKDGGRSLARWDANSASTLGIFGANGTGKSTSIGTMASLAMVRWGWRLWILDGKDAGDWDEFGNHATVEAVGQHNIEDVMQVVWTEYQRRERLMSDNRWRRYADMPAEVQAEFPQWGMVFEEYGATRLGLRQKTRTQLDQFIGILCQKARYTGWHGVFIDQRPSNYTDEMKGNLKSIACFQLKMNQGHAVNAYQADKLAPMGEFEMDGGRYWAFHAEPLARPMLATMPVRGAGRNLSPSFVDMDSTKGYESPTKAPPHETKAPTFREIPPAADAPTLVSIYERTRSWDSVAKAFFERDANQTQADLRRLMALIAGDGRPTTAFTGEAHRLYHTYNPKGNGYNAG
jgi:hypothetical protein